MSSSSGANTMKGLLKQQVLEPINSFYEWVSKYFVLHLDSGILESYDVIPGAMQDTVSATASVQLQISNAKYAKEWSSSSAIAGCGFDIVWGNGKIWSFLADSENACEQWVRTVNSAISSLPTPPSSRQAGDSNLLVQTQLDNMRSPYSYSSSSAANNNNNNNNTTIPYGTAPIDTIPLTPQAVHNSNNNNNNNDKGEQEDRPANVNSFPGDISEIPVRHSDQSSPANSETDSHNPTLTRGAAKASTSVPQSAEKDFDIQSILSTNTTKKASAAAKINVEKKKIGVVSSESTAALAQQIKLLSEKVQQQQSRIDELVQQTEKDAADANVSREQLVRIQQELENRTASYEKELQAAWEKDKEMMKSIREDAQRKIMEATKENLVINETATKLMTDQHAREITMLRDELNTEKRRYADLLRKEVDNRDRAEGKEIALKHEAASLADTSNRLAAELTRVREGAKSDSICWEQEKISLLSNHEGQVQRLTAEKEKILTNAQSEMRSKISEMSDHFHATIKSIETSIKETVKKQMEAEHMREMAMLQRQCTKDIEITRTEERRAQQAETDRVRNAFMDRERQTADDLMELEAIHASRVAKLERQIDDCHENINTLRSQVTELTNEIKRKDKFIAKQSADHMRKVEEQSAFASSSQEQLHDTHRQLQQSKVHELSYREQVSKLLEEGRLQRAELLELKRQLNDGAAQASSFKSFVYDNETSTNATASSLNIAKQEIAMLENELKRVRRERDNMKKSFEEKEREREQHPMSHIASANYHHDIRGASPAGARGRSSITPNKSSYDIMTGRKMRCTGTSRLRSVSPNSARHERCRVHADATPVGATGSKSARGAVNRLGLHKENISPGRSRSAVLSFYN